MYIIFHACIFEKVNSYPPIHAIIRCASNMVDDIRLLIENRRGRDGDIKRTSAIQDNGL